MTKLLQLPNGDWIDPNEVTSVYSTEPPELCGVATGTANVVVTARGERFFLVSSWPNTEEARRACDSLGRRINEARGSQPVREGAPC